MHILVDLDDTAVKWGEAKDRELRAKFPHLTNFKFGALQTTWDLYDGLDGEHRAAMNEVMDDPGFYNRLEPIEGAVEALHDMVAEGHMVSIVSTPWESNPTCMEDKKLTVQRMFGGGWGKRLVLTHDKTLVRGDILIDDRPQISGIYTPEWEHVLFDQYHNQHVDSKRRLTDWSQWRDVVAVYA